MILIHPSVEILYVCANPLQLIEAAGRTCYKSEEKITVNSAPPFVHGILKRGHESVIEHSMVTIRFVCDRGVSHEIVRHRLASYSQESTRYCDYNRGHVTFIIPPWVKIEPGEYTLHPDHYKKATTEDLWLAAMRRSELAYQQLRLAGWRPEQARSVLPNSLKTELVVTMNFRELRHFFKLRTAAAAHPQMRELTIPLLEMMKARVEVIFDDIEVVCPQ